MTTRRILLGLALLATTLLACAGTASAKFYNDGSVLPMLRPAFVTHAEAVAAAKKKSKAPSVTKVTPSRLKVGQKLYVYGKNFTPGKGKTKVFFLRYHHAGAAWVRADSATKTRIIVTVPTSLQKLIPASGTATRFQIRVLTSRFSSILKASRSPLISATPGGGAGSASGVIGPTTGVAGCNPNFSDPTVDSDKDLLPDVREHQIGTDPCSKDSDGDGVEDGYEYYSAVDLNSQALPYPWKMPYPNALFPDADIDYDGDGLTSADEFSLWLTYGNHALPLNYSAGKQTTVPTPAPTPGTLLDWSLDINGDGWLDDGERDGDSDGLSNWDEAHGRMTPAWWKAKYDGTNAPKETPYLVSFAGTNLADPDTDGDTLPDGADDNDFDGLSNMFEVARPLDWTTTYVSSFPGPQPGYNNGHNWTGTAGVGPGVLAGGADPYSRTNPFNPCKPLWSSICHQHPPFGYYDPTEDWAAPTPQQILDAGGPAPGTLP